MNIINYLEVENIYKSYGKTNVLKDVSFNLYEGEIVGLLGKNGTGKTTLMRLIAGLTQINKGNLKVFGLNPWKQREQLSGKVGYLLEPSFPKYLTGLQNLKFLAMLHHLPLNICEETLKSVGLWEERNKKVKNYSFGMIQRLGLAQAMLTNPRLLILDEPTVGMDPVGIKGFMDKLKMLRDNGVSILFSSHQLEEVEQLSSRILLLDKGELIMEQDTQSMTKTTGIKISTNDNQKAVKVLKNHHLSSIRIQEDSIYLENDEVTNLLNDAIKILTTNGFYIKNIDKTNNRLKNLFEKRDDKNDANVN